MSNNKALRLTVKTIRQKETRFIDFICLKKVVWKPCKTHRELLKQFDYKEILSAEGFIAPTLINVVVISWRRTSLFTVFTIFTPERVCVA